MRYFIAVNAYEISYAIEIEDIMQNKNTTLCKNEKPVISRLFQVLTRVGFILTFLFGAACDNAYDSSGMSGSALSSNDICTTCIIY